MLQNSVELKRSTSGHHPMQPVFILNPLAGYAARTRAKLDAYNIPYITTWNKEDLPALVKEQVSEGNHSFIICGGDGAINRFIAACMKLPPWQRKKISFGVIPCGTCNDLACALGIPEDFHKALRKALAGNPKELDLIRVNADHFITGGGLGLPVHAVQEALRRKRTLPFLYQAIVANLMLRGYPPLQGIRIDGKDAKELMLIAVQNQSFIGKRFRLAPSATQADGQMDICSIDLPSSRLGNLIMLLKVLRGTHIRDATVMTRKTDHVTISSKSPLWFMGDGELLSEDDSFKISILPRAIKVYR